jgi:hypothetical protein
LVQMELARLQERERELRAEAAATERTCREMLYRTVDRVRLMVSVLPASAVLAPPTTRAALFHIPANSAALTPPPVVRGVQLLPRAVPVPGVEVGAWDTSNAEDDGWGFQPSAPGLAVIDTTGPDQHYIDPLRTKRPTATAKPTLLAPEPTPAVAVVRPPKNLDLSDMRPSTPVPLLQSTSAPPTPACERRAADLAEVEHPSTLSLTAAGEVEQDDDEEWEEFEEEEEEVEVEEAA